MDHNYKIYYEGDTIFREGQPSDCAYIIDSGKVGIYREDSLGNRSLVRELGKNDLFGEMGLIDKYPRSATVIALEKTRCLIIERSRFDYLKKFKPQFMINLIKSLTEKLRTTIVKLNKDGALTKDGLKNKTSVSDYYHNKGG